MSPLEFVNPILSQKIQSPSPRTAIPSDETPNAIPNATARLAQNAEVIG